MLSNLLATLFVASKRFWKEEVYEVVGTILITRLLGISIVDWLAVVVLGTVYCILPRVDEFMITNDYSHMAVIYVIFFVVSILVARIKASVPVYYVVKGWQAKCNVFIIAPLSENIERAVLTSLATLVFHNFIISLVVSVVISIAYRLPELIRSGNHRDLVGTLFFITLTTYSIMKTSVIVTTLLFVIQNLISTYTGKKERLKLQAKGLAYTIIEIGREGECEPVIFNSNNISI
jgi:hypothetical protein